MTLKPETPVWIMKRIIMQLEPAVTGWLYDSVASKTCFSIVYRQKHFNCKQATGIAVHPDTEKQKVKI